MPNDRTVCRAAGICDHVPSCWGSLSASEFCLSLEFYYCVHTVIVHSYLSPLSRPVTRPRISYQNILTWYPTRYTETRRYHIISLLAGSAGRLGAPVA